MLMGLFASQRSGARRSQRDRRDADDSNPRRRGLIYLVAGTVTVCAGVVLSVHAMYRQVRRHPDFHVDPLAVELVEVPTWVPNELESELQHDHGLPPKPLSIFTPEVERALAERYAANPWVAGVEAVRRVYPGQIEIELELRRPAALIVLGDGQAVPIDKMGVRLPDLPLEDPRLRSLWLPQIQGVLVPPPAVGRPWKDRAVREGVALVEAVRPHYLKFLSRTVRFTAIDVSNVGGRVKPFDSELAFLTSDRVLVEWGRSPASPQPDPLTFEEKLRRLRNVLVEFPGLNGILRVKLDDSPGPSVVAAGTARNR